MVMKRLTESLVSKYNASRVPQEGTAYRSHKNDWDVFFSVLGEGPLPPSRTCRIGCQEQNSGGVSRRVVGEVVAELLQPAEDASQERLQTGIITVTNVSLVSMATAALLFVSESSAKVGGLPILVELKE
ncbi:hypothetical protein Q4I32_003273 [Leishmania shawi]|uniref:Uncharacterized protein n=1 Tax=Leishmania shawi TaxID=5680 RepID=A0AAW3BZK2_9TRYP